MISERRVLRTPSPRIERRASSYVEACSTRSLAVTWLTVYRQLQVLPVKEAWARRPTVNYLGFFVFDQHVLRACLYELDERLNSEG